VGRALEGKPHLEEAEERPAYPLVAALVQGRRFLGKGGTQGKTIPIAVGSPTRLGEVDNSHVVHDRGHPKKRPPTKYDSSMTHQNYEGICVQVKKGREQNPYISPKLAAIDYRF
jgi:hypothetical protein